MKIAGSIYLSALNDSSIRQEIVHNEPLVAVLPKSHALHKRPTISLEMLAAEPFLLYPARPRPSYADEVLALFERNGLKARVVQEVNEMQTALGLVAAGIGVTLVPTSVQKMRQGDVVYKSLNDPKIVSPIVMSYRDGDQSSTLALFTKRVRLLSKISGSRD